MREDSEIHEQIDKAADTENDSRWPGMTYEQGVRSALEWVSEETHERPMEDD